MHHVQVDGLLGHLFQNGQREGRLYEELSRKYMRVTHNMRRRNQDLMKSEVKPLEYRPETLASVDTLPVAALVERGGRLCRIDTRRWTVATRQKTMDLIESRKIESQTPNPR